MIVIRNSALILVAALLSACGQSGSDSEKTSSAEGSTAADTTTPVASAAPPPPAFAVCSSCHAVAPGRHGVGPSLAGIWGRKAASMPGYAYSNALKSSGIVWNAQTLDTWLTAPMKMVPGTKMVIGVPNPEGRKAVIDYLEKLK